MPNADAPRRSPGPATIVADASYGSDQAGLVCGYVFTSGGPGRAIVSADAAALLTAAPTPSAFLWLHFSLANTVSERWLRQHTSLPESFFAPQDGSSTHLEVTDEALTGVLNDVQFFPAEASAASTMTLHVSPRLMVTARTTALRAVDRLRASVTAGERFASPADLLGHLLRDQADVLVDIVRDATKQVDTFEDRIINQHRTSRKQLGQIRRILVRLLQEELTALLSERTNETPFILTVVTVFALPLTIIPGLFGMNVGGVPFAERAGGFWIVVLLVAAIVAAVLYLPRSCAIEHESVIRVPR